MPEEVESGVKDDEEEDDVAKVENDKVHPIGGDRAAVDVVKHLERTSLFFRKYVPYKM